MLVTTLCTVLRLVPVPSPTDVDRTASRPPPDSPPRRRGEATGAVRSTSGSLLPPRRERSRSQPAPTRQVREGRAPDWLEQTQTFLNRHPNQERIIDPISCADTARSSFAPVCVKPPGSKDDL
jgi:hypothetical protein